MSLARAALVDPAVLVLDEATSNLDPGTEFIVERALDSLMSGRTTIVVAHRLSTIQRADRIGVIDGGRLAELGNHAELVRARRTVRRPRRRLGEEPTRRLTRRLGERRDQVARSKTRTNSTRPSSSVLTWPNDGFSMP